MWEPSAECINNIHWVGGVDGQIQVDSVEKLGSWQWYSPPHPPTLSCFNGIFAPLGRKQERGTLHHLCSSSIYSTCAVSQMYHSIISSLLIYQYQYLLQMIYRDLKGKEEAGETPFNHVISVDVAACNSPVSNTCLQCHKHDSWLSLAESIRAIYDLLWQVNKLNYHNISVRIYLKENLQLQLEKSFFVCL